MVDGTTKFRLATAGSLLCVAALAWMYRMNDVSRTSVEASPAAKAVRQAPSTPATNSDEPERRSGHAEEDEQSRISQAQ